MQRSCDAAVMRWTAHCTATIGWSMQRVVGGKMAVNLSDDFLFY